MLLEPTGFCWNCGRVISDFEKEKLFCNDKCKNKYELKLTRDRSIRRGKKAGYGLAGSTH